MGLLPLHRLVFNGRKGASVRPSASVSALRGLGDTIRFSASVLRFLRLFAANPPPPIRPPLRTFQFILN